MSQAFAKYVDLDDVATRIGMHVSRALLVESVRTDEAGGVNPETASESDIRYAFRQTTEFSEIIFDYLHMLEQETEELRGLVDELRVCFLGDNKEKNPAG